ncbi:MAG: MarR family winged helix-turn-helix transcriptional regulator [Bacillota bacterium]
MNELKTLTILFRTTNTFEQWIKEDIKKYHLNVTEFGVLEALYHKGELTIQALKDKILIANSSLTYVLSQLIDKAFIHKRQQTHDKRVFTISLTTKGERVFKSIYRMHLINMRTKLNVLTKNEELTLQTLLKKIGKQEG